MLTSATTNSFSFEPSRRIVSILSDMERYNASPKFSQNDLSIFNSSKSNAQDVELSKELADLEKELNAIKARLPKKQNKTVSTPSYSSQNIFLNNYNTQFGFLNFNYVQPTTNRSTVKSSLVQSYTTTNASLSERLTAAGYDKEVAAKLATQSVAQAAGRTKSTGWCAKNVNDALEKAGIVKKNSTRTASAYQLTSVYEKNGAFTKIQVSKNELKDLPAGCIIVWQPGKGFGNAFAKHGHVVITQGNNKATSDYTQELKDYGTQFTVFVPKKK